MKIGFTVFCLVIFSACSLWVQAEEAQTDVRPQVEAVIEDFNKKKYDSAIERIDKISVKGESEAFLLNLKGAAYSKLKNFSEAERCFTRAIEISPRLFAAHFNLAEIEFLQGNYAKSLEKFKALLDGDPRNELLQFKVFLCHVKMGDDEAAKRVLARIKFPGETPAWYYAQAVWESNQGHKGKVAEYLAAARYLFQGKTELFDETLADLGLAR